jgi:nucleotide-binding universal stress UspA family protein
MALPKNILYPVDFSERSHQVWSAVRRMAEQLRASVTVLHVIDIDHLGPTDLSDELQRIRHTLEERLNHFPGSDGGLSYLRCELAEGPPAERIVQRAANMELPLIMMPTRGHTRFRQLLLGSVTAAVLHDATCPVWTERHTEAPTMQEGGYHSMVCAVDMGQQTPRLLKAADEFRRQFGASLFAVHSIPRGDARFSNALSDRAHALLVGTAREDYTAFCREARVQPSLEIAEEPSVVDGIEGAIYKHKADLLVIGRGVIQGTLGRLRSRAHDLIRRSPCPVLSI